MDLVLLSFWLELVVPVWDCTEIVNSYLAGWTCEELCSVGPKWKRVLSCNFTPTLSLSLSLSLRSPADVRTPLISTLAPLPCIVVSTPPPQLSRPAEGLFENEQTGEENRQRRGKTKTNQQTKKKQTKKTHEDSRGFLFSSTRCCPSQLRSFYFISFYFCPSRRPFPVGFFLPAVPTLSIRFFFFVLFDLDFVSFLRTFFCVCVRASCARRVKRKVDCRHVRIFFLWISRCDGSGAIISLTRNRFFFLSPSKAQSPSRKCPIFFHLQHPPVKKKKTEYLRGVSTRNDDIQ